MSAAVKRADGALLRVVAGEAAAYVKSGILATSGIRVERNATSATDVGVVFVHGFAARANQFSALQRVLGGETQWFDAYEYNALSPFSEILAGLRRHLDLAGSRCRRVVAIGHSLGGLLLRMVLQREDAPASVAAFVSICAPLHGTTRSRLGPTRDLRGIAPGTQMFDELARTVHRLQQHPPRVLAIGARRDHFIRPYTSAFLEGHERLELPDSGHVGSLFDPRVHDAVRTVVADLKRKR